MSFGQRGAAAGANGRSRYEPTYRYEPASPYEPASTQKTPFRFGAVALAALLAATTICVSSTALLLIFDLHKYGAQSTFSTISKMPILFLTMGIFYFVSFSLNEVIIKKFPNRNLIVYALAGAISPSVLVALFQLLMRINKGNYSLLEVVALGGLAGGILLGMLGRRSPVGAV